MNRGCIKILVHPLFHVNLVSTFDNLKTGCKPDKHWVLTTCQPFHKKNTVEYKIVGFRPPFLAMAELKGKLGSAHLA